MDSTRGNLPTFIILFFALMRSYDASIWCIFQSQEDISSTNIMLPYAVDCCNQQDCGGIWIQKNRNGNGQTSSAVLDNYSYLPYVKRVLTFIPPVEANSGGTGFLLAGGFQTNRELMICAEPSQNWKRVAIRLFDKSETVIRINVKNKFGGLRKKVLIESQDVNQTAYGFWRNVEPRPTVPFPFVTATKFIMSIVSKPGHIEIWVGKVLYSRYNISSPDTIIQCKVHAECYVHQFAFIDWDKI